MANQTPSNATNGDTEDIIAKLVTSNDKTAQTYDIRPSTTSVVFGRAPGSTIILRDVKCSGKHCTITIVKTNDDYEFLIEDTSSNGTFVNGNIIGKGKSTKASFGDILTILREAQVGPDDKIEFVIQKPTQKRTREPEEDKSNKKSNMDSKLEEEIKCLICMEVMYQPVTLFPCLHNYCGGCFSDWKQRSLECPNCRTKAKEVKKNHFLVNLIEIFLKEHPDAQRPAEELKDLDEHNEFKADRVKLAKDGFNSDGSASSGEEEKKTPTTTPVRGRGRGKGIQGGTRPLAVAQAQNIRQNICRQCQRRVDNFQCQPNQQHVQCGTCHQYMPLRPNNRQSCEVCKNYFCNLYWQTGAKCRNGVGAIETYTPTTFTAIPQKAINENKFEQTVLGDYLRAKRINFQRVANEMLTAMEQNQWNMNLNGNQVMLNKNSLICPECAILVWNELLYKYREKIPVNELPAIVGQRQDCWYGRECRTQIHNIVHAQKLNHICPPVSSI